MDDEDTDVDDGLFDEERDERHRILRERGYDPDELTLEEQDAILTDSFDTGETGDDAFTDMRIAADNQDNI